MISYILSIIAVLAVVVLYYKYMEKHSRVSPPTTDDRRTLLEKYFLYGDGEDGDSTIEGLHKCKKPILWIPIVYEYNARNWLSFGSRSSHDLNENYIYLTVKSIIAKCDKSFKIVILDDSGFAQLLDKEEWTTNMTRLSNEDKEEARLLGYTKLVYKYGGMVVPPSFICLKDLSVGGGGASSNALWNPDALTIVENVDYKSNHIQNLFIPDMRFFSAPRSNPELKTIMIFIENRMKDRTAHFNFDNKLNTNLLQPMYKRGEINIIDAKYVGVKDMNNRPVLLDHFMAENFIKINKNTYGIWFPQDQLKRRTNYHYFMRLSNKQLLSSDSIVAKYLLIANSPDGNP